MSQAAPLDLLEPDTGEHSVLEALRSGSEAAFEALVARYQPAMVRVARGYVREEALAVEVAQDTWLAVLRGLDAFEGRSSLRTWIFRILVNRARTAARREARSMSFSDAFGDRAEDDETVFEPGTFAHPLAPGHWTEPVRAWGASPEETLLGGEARGVIEEAVAALPPNQRAVITLRDIEGWEAAEVCNALELSEVHQRVLLHRARTKVRRALARYFDRGPA